MLTRQDPKYRLIMNLNICFSLNGSFANSVANNALYRHSLLPYTVTLLPESVRGKIIHPVYTVSFGSIKSFDTVLITLILFTFDGR